jgi:hypothetical protein
MSLIPPRLRSSLSRSRSSEALEGAVLGHLLQRLQAIDPLLDRLEVGERAAEPAAGDEELGGALGLLLNHVLGLLLGPHEEDRAAARGDLGDEPEGGARHPDRLL